MIEIRNVVKEFDGFRALDGLNMTVPDGAVYGLVGPNGAGKSTIIRHLTGIYRQDSGDVLVDGEPVFENPSVKNRIAYIPDDIFFFPNASISEMAGFYRSILAEHDCRRLLQLCKTIYRRQAALAARRKADSSTELRSWKAAEEMLHQEFGFVLGMKPAEVKHYLETAFAS